MTNTELVAAVAEKMDVTKKLAKEVVASVFETVQEGMVKDGVVKVSGFGAFEKKDVDERTCRNPQDGSTIVVPAHGAPKFRAASALKDICK